MRIQCGAGRGRVGAYECSAARAGPAMVPCSLGRALRAACKMEGGSVKCGCGRSGGGLAAMPPVHQRWCDACSILVVGKWSVHESTERHELSSRAGGAGLSRDIFGSKLRTRRSVGSGVRSQGASPVAGQGSRGEESEPTSPVNPAVGGRKDVWLYSAPRRRSWKE